jgi:RNA polymerase sigma factor (TIGR02999 family)
MRRILVDHARRKKAEKRGGAGHRIALTEVEQVDVSTHEAVLAVDEALAKLAAEDSSAASVASLRLFAGLTVEEASKMLGVSRATAFRDWAYARAWLTASLADR